MFNIGDKVAYPLYGAGIIEAIEEKHILQQNKTLLCIESLQSAE